MNTLAFLKAEGVLDKDDDEEKEALSNEAIKAIINRRVSLSDSKNLYRCLNSNRR